MPYGADGVERAPEGVRRTVEQTLDEAQHLLDTGRPFHAHEVFEDAWKTEPGPQRELWRGLAQLAVGLTHAARGNVRGAASLLRRGADVIEPFVASGSAGPEPAPPAAEPVTAAPLAAPAPAAPPVGAAPVDVAGLVSWARAAAADVAAGRQPTVPVLRR